jgi:hypothetical protein
MATRLSGERLRHRGAPMDKSERINQIKRIVEENKARIPLLIEAKNKCKSGRKLCLTVLGIDPTRYSQMLKAGVPEKFERIMREYLDDTTSQSAGSETDAQLCTHPECDQPRGRVLGNLSSERAGLCCKHRLLERQRAYRSRNVSRATPVAPDVVKRTHVPSQSANCILTRAYEELTAIGALSLARHVIDPLLKNPI